MKKVFEFLNDNFEFILLSISLVSMMILVFIQVCLRYLFGETIAWGQEFSRFALVWFIYLSCSYAITKNAHIRVTAITNTFSLSIRKRIIFLADFVWLCFCLVLIVKGIEMVKGMFEYKYVSAALKWNMAYIYSIIPIGFTLMALRLIQKLVFQFKNFDIEEKGINNI